MEHASYVRNRDQNSQAERAEAWGMCEMQSGSQRGRVKRGMTDVTIAEWSTAKQREARLGACARHRARHNQAE